MSVWNVFVSQNIRKLIVFLRVILDVDFSNDVPPPSVCIVVQAAGSIRPQKVFFCFFKENGKFFLLTVNFRRKTFLKNSYTFSYDVST